MLVEEQEEINTYSILQLLHSSLINHNQSTSTLYLIFGHLGTALIKRFLFLAHFLTDSGVFASIILH